MRKFSLILSTLALLGSVTISVPQAEAQRGFGGGHFGGGAHFGGGGFSGARMGGAGLGGARFAGAPRFNSGARFIGAQPFVGRRQFVGNPRFVGAGFARRHRRGFGAFPFIAAPFLAAAAIGGGYAYDDYCYWHKQWTPYGWQWGRVCSYDPYYSTY